MQGNNIKTAMPPTKGGFTWTHKYYWIPAELGEERDGVLKGREASTSFPVVPRMLKEGLGTQMPRSQELWEKKWGSLWPSQQKLETISMKNFSLVYLEPKSRGPKHVSGIKYRRSGLIMVTTIVQNSLLSISPGFLCKPMAGELFILSCPLILANRNSEVDSICFQISKQCDSCYGKIHTCYSFSYSPIKWE